MESWLATFTDGLMAIIPIIRCSRMAVSVAFYTKALDFERIDGEPDDADPSFSVPIREGDRLFLSSHHGDGAFGQAIVVLTKDVDALWREFRGRGLKTPGQSGPGS